MTDLATRPRCPAPNLAAIPAELATPAAQFLDDLFSGQSGLLCAGYIDGDPRIEEIDGRHQEWYDWPRQRSEVIDWLRAHNDRGHNTYVRMCLFTKKSGTKKNALPSRWIWQDEAKADTPCSILIETSEGNYQALICLDRLATTAERGRLMTAWRDARPHTDDCSADPVHFIRVPGGHNRKRHGDFTVCYAVCSERVYSADRLLARCQPGRGETHTPPAPAGLDQAALDYWQAHIDQLLNDDRTLPRAFVRDTPGRRILELRAAGKGMFFHASGTWDASRERLWLANSLVMARYLDEQIAALLWHFEVPATIEIKGEAAIWADITRVIGMARAAHPHITPRLYGARPEKAVKVPRGRAGNHAELVEQVYTLLLDYRAGAQAIIKTGEIAGVIGCHRRTIVTVLNELRDAGRIATKPLGQHGGLVVTFNPGVIYSESQSAESRIDAPETPPATAALGETEQECVSPDRATDRTSPTLDAVIWQALDALPRQRVNEKTGVVTTWPCTTRRICGWIAEQYPAMWPQWRRAAPAHIDRIRWQQRNARFAELDDLSPADLDRQITAVAGTIGDFERRAASVADERRAYYQSQANRRRGRLMMLLTVQARRDKREAWAGVTPIDRAELYARADVAIAEIQEQRAAGHRRRFVMPQESLPL